MIIIRVLMSLKQRRSCRHIWLRMSLALMIMLKHAIRTMYWFEFIHQLAKRNADYLHYMFVLVCICTSESFSSRLQRRFFHSMQNILVLNIRWVKWTWLPLLILAPVSQKCIYSIEFNSLLVKVQWKIGGTDHLRILQRHSIDLYRLV